jgi:hypothetical protein
MPNAAIMGVFCIEIMHPFHTQNRTVRTHHRTPGAQRWCSRLAMDVGEGQKQTRCSDSPVRRRGDAECSDNGGVLHRNDAPLLPLTKPDRPGPPPHSGRVRKDGVPASPWMWAKARSKLGAVIRLLCGDGVMPNAAIMGVFCIEMTHPFFHSQNRTVRTRHRTPAGCAKMVFPPRHGCGRRPEAN